MTVILLNQNLGYNCLFVIGEKEIPSYSMEVRTNAVLLNVFFRIENSMAGHVQRTGNLIS